MNSRSNYRQAGSLFAMITILLMSLAMSGSAETLPLTYKNSKYLLSYEAEKKLLVCSSDNVNAVWQIEISRKVPSFDSIAAIATAAGPVIVYTEDDQDTYFALPHFRTGSLKVEKSGEPLRGLLGHGRLLNCLFQAEDYGAKLVCQLRDRVDKSKLREYKWDVNFWGTHRNLGTSELQEWPSGQAELTTRVVNEAMHLRMEAPRGFRPTQLDETSQALYGPTNEVFMSVSYHAEGTPMEELAEAYMAELGVTVEHRSVETLDNGDRALLLMGRGVINKVESLHVALVYSKGAHTWVLSYTGRAEVGSLYVPAFMQLLQSFAPL